MERARWRAGDAGRRLLTPSFSSPGQPVAYSDLDTDTNSSVDTEVLKFFCLRSRTHCQQRTLPLVAPAPSCTGCGDPSPTPRPVHNYLTLFPFSGGLRKSVCDHFIRLTRLAMFKPNLEAIRRVPKVLRGLKWFSPPTPMEDTSFTELENVEPWIKIGSYECLI